MWKSTIINKDILRWLLIGCQVWKLSLTDINFNIDMSQSPGPFKPNPIHKCADIIHDFKCLLLGWYSIALTSQWASWRLKSPGFSLLVQQFDPANIKENMKAPRYWHLWGESTSDRSQWASYKENVSIWWRHRANMILPLKTGQSFHTAIGLKLEYWPMTSSMKKRGMPPMKRKKK